jgi:ABC-type phosphate transport system, periplasmic component
MGKQGGYGKAVNWPTGIGAKGNEGVANYLKRLRGAIGYVEYAYARQNRLTVAAIENRDGAFVAPSLETFQAAAAHARWSPDQDFYEVLTWQPGKDAYPITGATFILMARDYPPERNRKIVDFFRWAFEHGDSLAVSLDYVPLPKKVKTAIQAYWKQLGWLP